MRAARWAFLLAAIVAGPAAAQDLSAPPGWVVRGDRPAEPTAGPEVGEGQYHFVAMPPGWHMTMGPGGLVYHPGEEAGGRFVLESEILLFPGASDEGYGLFFGGQDLDGVDAGWLAAVLRRDGSAALVRRAAGRDDLLTPWTAHAAIKPQAGSDVVGNTLRVGVERDSLHLSVNGERVLAVPASGLATEGRFGFRVGQGLNLHASSLDLTRRLARPRGG